MSNLVQNTTLKSLTVASAALIALIVASPIVPASAQGVPAGLLRLDPPQSSTYDSARMTEAQQTKLRSSYAHVRKTTHAQ